MGEAYSDNMANVGTLFPALLIVLFLGAVIGGTTVAFLVAGWRRKQLAAELKEFRRTITAIQRVIQPA